MSDPIYRLPFFTDDHRAFQESVEDFMRKEASIEYAYKLEQSGEYPYDAMDKLAALGYLGTTIPVEHGGAGLDTMYFATMVETMSRHCDALAVCYALVTWGIHDLLKFGTPEQQAYYLPRALQGKVYFAAGITEPNAGGDAASLSLSAVEQGDHYVLNGEKLFITGAHARGTVIIVFARTDRSGPKHYGITAFLVPNDTPGLRMQLLKTLARNTPAANRIYFDDVKVPRSSILGSLHKGWQVLIGHLVWERIHLGAQYGGMTRLAADLAIDYAKKREQFGRPVGQFQVIKHMLVDMDTEAEAARTIAYRAAWLHANGLATMKDASRAKLVATEALQRVATNAMQVLGAYGQMPEFHVERLYRVAKLAVVGGGSSQILRSTIGKELGL